MRASMTETKFKQQQQQQVPARTKHRQEADRVHADIAICNGALSLAADLPFIVCVAVVRH